MWYAKGMPRRILWPSPPCCGGCVGRRAVFASSLFTNLHNNSDVKGLATHPCKMRKGGAPVVSLGQRGLGKPRWLSRISGFGPMTTQRNQGLQSLQVDEF